MKTKSPKKSNASTQFQPGKSGNNRGRPPLSVKTKDLRDIILKHSPELIYNLINKALEGDLHATELLLDRVLPRLKPQTLPIEHPIPQGDISSQAQHVFHATAKGDISIEQAEGLNRIGGLAINISNLQGNGLHSSSVDNLEIANDYTMDQSISPTNTGVTVIERKTFDSLIAEPNEVLDKSIQDTGGSNETS